MASMYCGYCEKKVDGMHQLFTMGGFAQPYGCKSCYDKMKRDELRDSFKQHYKEEDAANLKSDGWAHVATLDAKVFVENAYRQESEAQARFDAALGYLSTESERWYDSQDNAFYPEDTSLIKAALKIAAGLDTTE